MNKTKVMMVRVYTSESSHLLKKLIDYLRQDAKISGFSVFRGIGGYGGSGEVHDLALVDLSLDLPLIIEFFDNEEKIKAALDHIPSIMKPEHIVCWEGCVYQ